MTPLLIGYTDILGRFVIYNDRYTHVMDIQYSRESTFTPFVVSSALSTVRPNFDILFNECRIAFTCAQ